MTTRRAMLLALFSAPLLPRTASAQPQGLSPTCPVCGVRDFQYVGLVVMGRVTEDGFHQTLVNQSLHEQRCKNCGTHRSFIPYR